MVSCVSQEVLKLPDDGLVESPFHILLMVIDWMALISLKKHAFCLDISSEDDFVHSFLLFFTFSFQNTFYSDIPLGLVLYYLGFFSSTFQPLIFLLYFL
jgi:hypothetical protein